MKYENAEKNISIIADKIEIGEGVEFGRDIDVKVHDYFSLGNYSRLGDDCQIRGKSVNFEKHFFNSSGLRVGGGGRNNPKAWLNVGSRCTLHNNFINVCEPVYISCDVGLSADVSILTHGYWLSVLDGYPAKFAGVRIGSGVIVGYRSLIMMGVSIADECVIGAQSVVTKSIEQKGIYAGSPARLIREIKPLSHEERLNKINDIIVKYFAIANYHNVKYKIEVDYPFIQFNDFRIHVETFGYSGDEDEHTDDFRDYLRKYGIRIYTKRPFRSKDVN